MKMLRPLFQRSKLTVSVGFLVSVAGIILSAPVVHAGGVPGPPRWIRFEMDAIGLYETGINQENSNPQAAVNTLRQARLDSTAAITNGGNGNPAVMHNDSLIGRALTLAEADAPGTLENTKATQTPKSGAKNLARPAANRIQATINIKRAVK